MALGASDAPKATFGASVAASAGADAILAHLGMSGQMLVAAPGRPDEKHLRIRIAFDDEGPELRFVDQRTFGGLSVHPLVPAAASDGRLPGVVRSSLADARCDAPAPFASGDGELLPAPISHIARDPMAVSGIGNIYADEALWRGAAARARPTEKRPVRKGAPC